VLEAMARGVPVATSGRASLAEVAGDAALMFDPEDEDSIAAAIESILGDVALRERVRSAGRERAAGYTWERTAEMTVATYRRALAER
jgi:alpha-1,3-rhamnosyl/mannosyltransferase